MYFIVICLEKKNKRGFRVILQIFLPYFVCISNMCVMDTECIRSPLHPTYTTQQYRLIHKSNNVLSFFSVSTKTFWSPCCHRTILYGLCGLHMCNDIKVNETFYNDQDIFKNMYAYIWVCLVLLRFIGYSLIRSAVVV